MAEEKTQQAQILACISNRHKTTAPDYSPDNRDVYFGYFENCFGEQWVFTYDYVTDKALLAGGDVGWEQYPVRESGYVDLVLSVEEASWLQACWHAAVILRRNYRVKPAPAPEVLPE